MKAKFKKVLKKILFLLLFSIIILGIGYLIALIISTSAKSSMSDIMCYEGILAVIIGVFLCMKGNPSGLSISGMGQSNPQYISFQNLEVTRIEREQHPYYKDFFKNAVVEFAFSGVTIILSGIFMLIISLLYSIL
ncbi:MAG: hypothetical protein RR444_02080 [Oscillospiraceae bacterium]